MSKRTYKSIYHYHFIQKINHALIGNNKMDREYKSIIAYDDWKPDKAVDNKKTGLKSYLVALINNLYQLLRQPSKTPNHKWKKYTNGSKVFWYY